MFEVMLFVGISETSVFLDFLSFLFTVVKLFPVCFLECIAPTKGKKKKDQTCFLSVGFFFFGAWFVVFGV